MEDYISRTVGAVKTQGEAFDSVEKYHNNPENQSLYEIGTLSHMLIDRLKVLSIPMKVSHTGIEFKDVPPEKKLQSKGNHLSV